MTGLSTKGTDLSGEVLGSPFTLPEASKPSANVYVDGFNLYRRALENTRYMWLDIDALESDPIIVIYKGQFRSDIKLMPVVPWEFDKNGDPVTVKVRKRKEKGSDVNLAPYPLLGAFMNQADSYFVLSNDSDFAEPIKVVNLIQ